MSADARNYIIGIVITIIGIYYVKQLGQSYVGEGVAAELIESMLGMADPLMIGLGILALLLIPFWLSQRSEKKKE